MKQKSRIEDKTRPEEPEIKISVNGKLENTQNQLSMEKPQGHQRRNSGTYEKIMENFEDKISNKIDQLMNKYTQIEQRLDRSESNKNI